MIATALVEIPNIFNKGDQIDINLGEVTYVSRYVQNYWLPKGHPDCIKNFKVGDEFDYYFTVNGNKEKVYGNFHVERTFGYKPINEIFELK
jgi:hypothetical protein